MNEQEIKAVYNFKYEIKNYGAILDLIEKQNKVIDEMAEILAVSLKWDKLKGRNFKERKEIIKSSFYKKVEGEIMTEEERLLKKFCRKNCIPYHKGVVDTLLFKSYYLHYCYCKTVGAHELIKKKQRIEEE